jgi:hypothetical protein
MFNNRKITIKSKISIERLNRKIEILKKSLYIFSTPNFIIIIITTIVMISITINKTIVHFECYNECDSDLFAITKKANYFLVILLDTINSVWYSISIIRICYLNI